MLGKVLMKRRKRLLYITALFSFLFFSFYLLPHSAGAEVDDEVVIDRYPQEELFKVENTKPGDHAYRSLLIQNNNNLDIFYTMQLRNDGDLKLFNELLLQITVLDEIIFDGKLKDFDGFMDRPLDTQSEETIGFNLKFPEELGNDFQGLRADFVLVFNARAAESSGLVTPLSTEGKGGMLPRTATNILSYLLIGGLLLTIGGIASYLSRKNKQIDNS